MKKLTEAEECRLNSFIYLMRLLSSRIDSRMVNQLNEIGLDLKMFVSLAFLNEKDGITQRELGKLIDFPDYTTSRNVDVLENAGLVERRKDPSSRRSHLIFLTKAGRKKASQLHLILEDNNKEILKKLSKKENEQLIKLLQKAAGITEA